MTLAERMMETARLECRAASKFYEEPWVPGGLPFTGRGCEMNTVERVFSAINQKPGITRVEIMEACDLSLSRVQVSIKQLNAAGRIHKKMNNLRMTYCAVFPANQQESIA